jgi:hypothetical protein
MRPITHILQKMQRILRSWAYAVTHTQRSAHSAQHWY